MKRFILMIAFVLLAGGVHATTTVINSLPYTFDASMMHSDVDTLVLAGTKMTSSGHGIELKALYANELHDVVVLLDKDTLIYGAGNGSSSYGIRILGTNVYRPHNIKIVGGYILHGATSPSVEGCSALNIWAQDITVEDVTANVKGRNAHVVTVGNTLSYNITFNGGLYRSEVTGYDSRCDYDGAAMYFVGMGSQDLPDNNTFHVIMDGVTIENSPHAAIALLGRQADDNVKAKIVNCNITVDAHNDMYTSYSGTCQSAVNSYGINARFCMAGSIFSGNTIRSGSNYGGGRGILVEYGYGSATSRIEISNNDILVHEGKGAWYPEYAVTSAPPTWGMRLRYKTRYTYVHNNTVTVLVDANGDLNDRYSKGAALFLDVSGGAAYHIMENNQFIISNPTGGNVDANAFLTAGGDSWATPFNDYHSSIIRNNRFESPDKIIGWSATANLPSGGSGLTLEDNTYAFSSIANSDKKTFMLGYTSNNWVCQDNTIIDGTYENGANSSDINFSVVTTSDIKIQKNFDISVLGNDGNVIRGADVTVRNNLNQSKTAKTSLSGIATIPMSYLYENSSGLDSANYNNFTVTVSYNGETKNSTVTVDAFTNTNIGYTMSSPGNGGLPNQAPSFNTVISDTSISEGNSLAFTLSATDDYSVPVMTASTLPTGASFSDNGNGTASFSWAPNNTQSGNYTVNFYATDEEGLKATMTVNIEVGDNIPPGAVTDFGEQPGSEIGLIEIQWKATGADGDVGTVDHYEVVFSRYPIDQNNWMMAQTFSDGMPPPLPPNQYDTVVLGHNGQLTPGDFYYYGIVAFDPEGSPSPVTTTGGYAAGIKPPLATNINLIVNFDNQTATVETPAVDSTYFSSLNYEFQSDDNGLFSSPQTVVINAPIGNSISAEFSNLPQSDTTFWRCRALSTSPAFQGRWSNILGFDLVHGALDFAPTDPIAIEPLDGAVVTSLTPILRIENSVDPENGLVTYDFQVLDSAGLELVYEVYDVAEGAENTAYQVPANILADQTYYTWQARAFDGVNTSNWSALARFQVSTLSSSAGGDSDDFVAYAFPNPVCFNNDAITFMLPTDDNDLYIQTISGETVLLAKNVSAAYEWSGLNASGNRVASGVYLWYLSDGKNRGKIVVTPY